MRIAPFSNLSGGFRRSDRQSEASIGCQSGARDVTRLVRAKKNNRPGDLLGASCASRVNTLLQHIVVNLVADDPAKPLMHRRNDDPWTDNVDPDPLWRQLRRHT